MYEFQLSGFLAVAEIIAVIENDTPSAWVFQSPSEVIPRNWFAITIKDRANRLSKGTRGQNF
jgi:hypothetical protein